MFVLPHTPLVEPGGMMQGKPVQQSACVVQKPLVGTQLPPQTNGEPPGVGFGTHGKPQQSALVEHGKPAFEPASTQLPAPVQRGIPRLSC
jgi:hypothetical protein